MNRINALQFLFAIGFLGLIWWVMKPVIDMFTVDLLNSVAVDFGITAQELAYWTVVPFIIGGMLVVWLVLRLVKGRNVQ